MKLKDRIALVTGGSRSIGRAIAIGLAREGAHVAVNYVRHKEAAAETVDQIRSLGRRALAVQADTSVRAEVERMVSQTLAEFGRIDILVNNAGALTMKPFLDLTEEEWDSIVSTNLKGYFLVSQSVAREMVKRGRGKIINVTSEAQQKALPNLAHYCASKAGAYMLSRTMALELARYHINVNIIAPGPTLTDLNRERYRDPAVLERRVAGIPLGRMGNPEDIVGAAVYLASDDADHVTGAVIAVDGGTTI